MQMIRRGPDLSPLPDSLTSTQLLERYQVFLESKINMPACEGIDVPLANLHQALRTRPFEHQGAIVEWALRGGKRLIAAQFGLGKCHGLGTKILMADGTIKNVEDVQAGDQLMGDDGTPRNVLSLARGREQMYRITLKNGDSYTCNESHMLSLKVSNSFSGYHLGDVVNVSLRDYLHFSHSVKLNKVKHYKVAIDFDGQDVPMDPYLYGAWLGDLSVHDYSRMQCLNGQQTHRRLEKHICPLPIDLVRWVIERFTNPGDVVCDMFAGIFTVPYVAIDMGRDAIGIELNEMYWATGVKYCQEMEVKRSAPTLFDMMELEHATV